jgi:hypothetical protein
MANNFRTTVTLDPDVQDLLKRAMRDRRVSFKRALNDAVRASAAAVAPAPKPFVQHTFDMGAPLVDLTLANQLAAELEDQELIARMRRGSDRAG